MDRALRRIGTWTAGQAVWQSNPDGPPGGTVPACGQHRRRLVSFPPMTSHRSRIVNIGLVQQRASGDAATALARAIEGVRAAAAKGAQIVCLQELFHGPYFCQTEDHGFFELAEPIPGPTTDALGKLAAGARRGDRRQRCSRSAPRASITTPPRSSTPTAATSASTGRCTSRTTRSTTRSSTSRRATWASGPGTRASAGSACWSAGTSGIPRPRGSPPCAAPQILFYPTAIGWLLPEKAEYGGAAADAWETIQRSHAIANGVLRLRREPRRASRTVPAGGIEFWGQSFVADPGGRVLAKAGAGEEVLVVPCDLAKVDVQRTHWPFLRDRRIDARYSRRYIDESVVSSRIVSHELRTTRLSLRARLDSMPDSRRPRLPMPAEWEPHRGTWLSWPHKEASLARQVRPGAGHLRANGARSSAGTRKCTSTCAMPAMEAAGARACSLPGTDPGNVFFHHFPTNDAWCRDHGPIFLQRDTPRASASRPSWTGTTTPGAASIRRSTSTTSSRRRIGEEFGIPVFHPGIVMEGGSIDVNGAGTLLTTEACLLNPNRNPQLSTRRDRAATSATTSACGTSSGWATASRATTPTATSTTSPGSWTRRTVVTVVEDDPADDELRAAPGEPGAARDDDGPGRPTRCASSRCRCRAALYHEGQRLPASYANFYIANGVVLLPTYDRAADDEAARDAAAALPDPARRRHRLHRPGLGPRRLPLRAPAVAGALTQDLVQVPTSAA